MAINTGDRAPTPPGLFAIHDGFGVVVKRLHPIYGSDPQAFRVISDNERHPEDRLVEGEISIIGRVVWLARRM